MSGTVSRRTENAGPWPDLLRVFWSIRPLFEIEHAAARPALYLAAECVASLRTIHVEAASPCERIGIFPLIEALARTAAAYPAHLSVLLELLQAIRQKFSAAEARAGESPACGREEMKELASRMSAAEFITEQIAPILNRRNSENCLATIVQNTGTGRVTLRCFFGDDETIYTKLYSDGLGLHSYRVLRSLWDDGFNTHSRFQVPEPLSFLPQHNLLLTRSVAGQPLGLAIKNGNEADLMAGTRAAAGWLAALHRSSVRVGDSEQNWDSLKLFRIGVRLLKAAAVRPSQCEALVAWLLSLRQLVLLLPPGRPVVQTHGRFHHDHIFINDGATAVIDLDRSQPSDPAKDVAEFLRVLRWTAFKSGCCMRVADEATTSFLAEYLAECPRTAGGLSYHWASFLTLSLFGSLRKSGLEGSVRQTTYEFHLQEIQRALETRL